MTKISITRLKKHVCLICALVSALALAKGLHYGMESDLMATYMSPRGVYRLDYYHASLFQSVWNYRMESPSFIRLYKVDPEVLLGESEIVNIWMDGQFSWDLDPPMGSVRVGRDVVFENIPPECSDCPPLTRKQVVCGADPICLMIHSDPWDPQETPSDG